jgi:hypothetical protein
MLLEVLINQNWHIFCWYVVIAQDGAVNGCFRDSRIAKLCGLTGRRGRQREPCSGGWGGFPSLQTLALD